MWSLIRIYLHYSIYCHSHNGIIIHSHYPLSMDYSIHPYLSIYCLSIHLYFYWFCPSIYQSTYPCSIRLLVSLPICISTDWYWLICLYTYILSCYLHIHFPINFCSSIDLLISLSLYLSTYLSIYTSLDLILFIFYPLTHLWI